MDDILSFWKEHFDYFCKMYKTHRLKVQRISPSLPQDIMYISDRIKHEINSNLLRCVKSGNIEIYFKRENKYFLEFLMFYINFLMYIMDKIKPNNNISLHVNIYLTDFEKVYPENMKDDIGIDNVNSGFTIFIGNFRGVYVYRKEEVFKVILHELIHAFKLEGFDHMVQDDNIQVFFRRFQSLHVMESLTDTLACLYNVVFFSMVWSKLTGWDYHKSFKMFLKREREYIICQSRNVLLQEEYRFTKTGLVAYGRPYEKSHIISYYVLKALNYYYIKDFLGWLKTGNQMEYIAHLERCLKSQGGYWSKLAKCSGPWNRSLRMSDIDINILLISQKNKLLKTLRG